ncbi:CHAT domain-containing protein [Frigidibacter sp. ROC022]|uniref:CHAT domain-containing protein n=1 Tax=Frigidibacter sp. ROC022 TaxID=2971796 RepID=UPI00215B39D7|nr:CHAT domain-containing protein [Frigidibacter sp. ROC022]MCR8724202.1 CHAT domain-containing protein [Frigidibacter sp. ROC022]
MRNPVACLALVALLALLALSGRVGAETRAEVRDRVFLSAQTAAASAAGQALAQAAVRIAAGTDELAALLRQRQDAADALQEAVNLLGVLSIGTGSRAESEVERLRGVIEARRGDLERFDARLARDFPEFRELTNPSPMSLPEVQAALAPGEALILTLTDDTFFYIWAVSKTEAAWNRVEIDAAQIEGRVKVLRGALTTEVDNRGGIALGGKTLRRRATPFNRAASWQLWSQLFAPVAPVFAGADHLMLVLDGPLTSLPPAVLVTAPPEGDDSDPAALRATPWLVRSHALTTLPSVSALGVLRRAKAPLPRDPGASPFVGFGDPLLGYRLDQVAAAGDSEGAVFTRGAYEDVARVADLTPLPNTAAELRALAQAMAAPGGSVHLGAAATEAAVKAADLSQADVIAFATHGLLADGLPGLSEPALVFTPPAAPSELDDALLTASEAAQLKLSANLVILSACNTAGSDGTPGAEGLSGLARAFIFAGARAILVSHWPVDDYAARVLTTGMLGRMYDAEHPAPRAEALRQAMLALLDDRSEDRFAQPRIWAPFVVVGEGGAGF